MGMMTAGLRRLRRLEPNPILVKELRSRFRGSRAFWTVSGFLTALTLAVWWSWWSYRGWATAIGASAVIDGYDPAAFGRRLFQNLSWLELISVLVIAPALTFSAISGERERQTLDLILATPQSGWAILLGKLGAAMAYVLLLVFSALPVLSLVFFFGGVSWHDVLRSQLAVVAAGLTLATLGLLASVIAGHTVRAAVLAYAATGLLTLGPLVLLGFTALDQSGYSLLTTVLFGMSPVTMRLAIGGSTGAFLPLLLAQGWLAMTFLFIAGWRLAGTLNRPRRLLLWPALAVAWLVWIATTHPNGLF